MARIIGRKRELNFLEERYERDKSELLVIYGRRRVGKTFLVTQAFKDRFAFKHTGLSPYEDEGRKVTMADQLQAFHYSLIRYGESRDRLCPKSWMEAFFRLEELLTSKRNGEKMVVFIDELPWMDTPRSGFLTAFESFYNGWASGEDDVLVVVCGSSSSWMLTNLINNKGGMYDRQTLELKILPFSLKETEEFLRSKDILLDRYDIVRAYMAVGGIPYYLDYFMRGRSFEQNMDELFFREGAPMRKEFSRLFRTLFSNSESYATLVRFLAGRRYGYTREEIVAGVDLSSGGGLTEMLTKLEETDFIEKYKPVAKEGGKLYYRLMDSFTVFYLHFIDGNDGLDEHYWTNSAGDRRVSTWNGIAFEQVCLSHVESLKRALGISGIATTASKYLAQGGDGRQGAQIDLVIDRADKNVNLCEMKFYAAEVSLDKEEDLKIRNRVEAVRAALGRRGTIFPTLVTTYGLKRGAHSGVIQNVITLDDLFEA